MNKSFWTTSLLLATLSFTACKKTTEEATTTQVKKITLIDFKNQNNLDNTQSGLLESQVQSLLHWQPWSTKTFAIAAQKKKTVFALIGSGSDPYCLNALKQLNSNTETASLLNKNHINILVDSQLFSDLEFFTATLCLKSGSSPSSPLLVWFSYEGIPISWIPLNHKQENNIADFISRTSHTVSNMWRDSPEYVLKNSRDDFSRRMENNLPTPVEDKDNLMCIRSIRQAASLFDPTSATIDGAKGLTVARYVKLLTIAAQTPDITKTQQQHYLKIAQLTADNLILQGLIDPLDHGVYSGVQQASTALPIFAKKLSTQAYTIDALYTLFQASGNPRYRTAASAILAYTKQNLTLPDGGYALGSVQAGIGASDNPCIWTIEELQTALSTEEMTLCQQAFDIKKLGNIPLEDDPGRHYFKKNSLTWKHSLTELSTITGTPKDALQQKLNNLTEKLAQLRTKKSNHEPQEKLSLVAPSALMIQAQITAYRATGEAKYLEMATQGLSLIQSQFIDSTGQLHHARYQEKSLKRTALGADYVKLTQAALDLYAVTLTPKWLKLASSMHEQMTQNLGDSSNHLIEESIGTDYPHPFKIQQFLSIPNLDNTNTWAIAYSNAKRLEAVSSENTKALKNQSSTLHGILLASLKISPLASIDFLTEDSKMQRPCVFLKMPVSPELLKAAATTPSLIIPIPEKTPTSKNFPQLGNKASSLPSGSATVIWKNQILGTSSQAADLPKLFHSITSD